VPSTTGTSVSTFSATEDIVAKVRAAMVLVVKALTDIVKLDTVPTTIRIHKLSIFDGTKEKWLNWHWLVKHQLLEISFASGSNGKPITTATKTTNDVALRKLVLVAVQSHTDFRFNHHPCFVGKGFEMVTNLRGYYALTKKVATFINV
jgi:hypothetical protein